MAAQQQNSAFSLKILIMKIIVVIMLIYVSAWILDTRMQWSENIHDLTLIVRADAFKFFSDTYVETH
jgi:hypothetical protein